MKSKTPPQVIKNPKFPDTILRPRPWCLQRSRNRYLTFIKVQYWSVRVYAVQSKQQQDLARLSFCVLQSVYGVPDDGQSQPSPVHISSQPTRKTTKEDVQKEVTRRVAVFSLGHYHRSASLICHSDSQGRRLMSCYLI